MSCDRYILWDFDETLAWRPGRWSGTLAAVANEYKPGAGLTYDHFHPLIAGRFLWSRPEHEHPHLSDPDCWWSAMNPLFAEAFRKVGFAEDEAQSLAAKVRRQYIEPVHWRLFDDTVETLDMLSSRGWKHAILSNHVPELPAIVEALGLTRHFQAIFNSAQTGIEKPNLKAYRHALDCLQADPESTWMVGDNVKADVLVPESLGIRTVLARNTDPQAPRSCNTLTDIPDIVSNPQ